MYVRDRYGVVTKMRSLNTPPKIEKCFSKLINRNTSYIIASRISVTNFSIAVGLYVEKNPAVATRVLFSWEAANISASKKRN